MRNQVGVRTFWPSHGRSRPSKSLVALVPGPTTPATCPSRHRVRWCTHYVAKLRQRALCCAPDAPLRVADTPDFGRFGRFVAERSPNEREDAPETRPEVAFLVLGTWQGQGAPGGEWRTALGVWGISLLPPLSAPILAPLGTGHTDLGPAQRRGHSRANSPKAWCNRAGKASTSDCEVPVATAGLWGWCARSGTRMLAAASSTRRHVTSVHQRRRAEAPRHPEAAHSTPTGHMGRVERQLGASGRLRARSAARRRTASCRPVGGGAAREMSGRAARDG